MPDYSKGKIYTIRSHQTDDIYIGSTTQSLNERLRGHKRSWYSWTKNRKGNYVSSYEILKYDDAYIELLEDCDCERKEQLHKREGQLIREMDCVNKFIAGRTDKEYREENKEKLAEQRNKYKKENKQSISQQGKVYYQNNKEKILNNVNNYRNNNKEKIAERKKLYGEKNKEKIAERGKLYREKHKERIKAKKTKKYNCECGGKYTHCHKAEHFRSKKHQAYLKSLNKT